MIAFCFLTYGDLNQVGLWRRFFAQQFSGNHPSGCNIYFHNKQALEDEIFSRFSITGKVPTRYGHISLVRATLKLFETAWQTPENSHFVLVSDSCIPLYTFSSMARRVLALDQSLITQVENTGNRRKYLAQPDFFVGDEFAKQSQWMIMHRDAFPRIADNDVTETVFGDRIFAADEHYFISLYRRLGIPYVDRAMTSIDWSRPVVTKKPYHYSPYIYDRIDEPTLEAARAAGNLFLRKVSRTCRIPETVLAT